MYRCKNGEVVDTPMIDEVLSEGFNYSNFILESKKIDNFDKLHFILETTMGFMVIKGEGLELIKLDTLAGNVTIKGTIDSINYVVENKKKEEDGIFNRLFK